MSRYDPLWRAIQRRGKAACTLSFAQIEAILGAPIDHAFLRYKKELTRFGYQVDHISLKAQTVRFVRLPEAAEVPPGR